MRVAEDTRPGPWLAAPHFVLQDKAEKAAVTRDAREGQGLLRGVYPKGEYRFLSS